MNDLSRFLSSVIETTNVCTFANSVVQKLCSQDWLKENCLRNGKFLFSPEGLLDPEISEVQVVLYRKLNAARSAMFFYSVIETKIVLST